MNLLVLCSDQHSPRALGSYGHPLVRTPNLDSLAERGTRFENAYCSVPICVPSRASFATGRYAHTRGWWDNAKPYIGTEAPSWGHRLTESGYRVTTIGKLHYRSSEDPTGFPDQRVPMHVTEGVGDLFGLLRGEMPPLPRGRMLVTKAGAGESPYIPYDRSIADETVRWLQKEAGTTGAPWATFVSLATPHNPLLAPAEYFDQYPIDDVPMPIAWRPNEWARHPALDFQRRCVGHEAPFEESDIRRAIAAYFGLVTFMDAQVGKVLDALTSTGLAERTRVLYLSDHGDTMGEHGLWMKMSMYDGSAGVPFIMSGPDVPEGRSCRTPVSLIDLFPTILDAADEPLQEEDFDLPGTSLMRIADQEDQSRTVFAEYHGILSANAVYMLRDERHKYIHYVDQPPQLFDLVNDPEEVEDLASDPDRRDLLAAYESQLRELCDPNAVDAEAKEDQQRRLEEHGGLERVLDGGMKVPYTSPPNPSGQP